MAMEPGGFHLPVDAQGAKQRLHSWMKGFTGNLARVGSRFQDERSEAALAAADRRGRAGRPASDNDYINRLHGSDRTRQVPDRGGFSSAICEAPT
jgi:hypothetical protein